MTDPSGIAAAEREFQRQLRDMNEALLVSSVRQHELTEKAQMAEAALRASQEQLRRNAEAFSTLVEQSPYGIYVVDAAFRIAKVSTGAQAAFRNITPLIGRDFAEATRILWPEPFASETIDIFRHTLETGETYIAPSLTEKRHDLETIESYEWQTHRVMLADGRFGVVCYFFDTTNLRQAEKALRESEERCRTLADNMSQLAWTADAKGWIYWYNARWYHYTGTTLEEMQGWGWTKVLHPDHVDRVVERIQRAWDTGVSWEDTFPLRGKDGAYRWFLSHALPIRDAAGNVLRWFGTNTDVTTQREMETRILQQAEQLVGESRLKDEFLAMLSHELRNPLAAISNAIHLLRLQRGTENQLELQARAIIERQVGRLKHLIDDLLEISRITSGRIHLRRERVAVAGIVEQATETARSLIEQRRHEFTVTLPLQAIWTYGDPARLEQVVVNLLTNAAKYTDEGGQIWLTVQQEGDAAVLRVRDTGVGIAADLLHRIFDLFTQADRSLARSEGGLGIGLALVQRVVELHGGTVEASSVLGQGSEFVVRLPVMMWVPPAMRSPENASESARPAVSLRILVVDDNRDSAESVTMLLRVLGHEARMVHDGPATLEAVLDYRPDVVLLDIGLPGLNGFEVAKRLRSQPFPENVVLVALTGYGHPADEQQARDAGFDHYLVKPANFKQLESVLAAVPAKAS